MHGESIAMPLSRDQILGAEDLKREEVAVPEWGGSVFVRTMTGSERDRFEAAFVRDKSDTRARLAAATICDEGGRLLFAPGDIEALGRKSAAALERVFAVAMRLSRVGKDDVDELEGNSAASPFAASPSA
jgi:hypothetical protein